MKYLIKDHKVGVDFWKSKEDLRDAFFGEFYKFIKKHNGEADLEAHDIKSKEDFIKYADWYADGKENCYAMGFSFHKYYLEEKIGGKLEEQSSKYFIGWCVKHHKFEDFINFLITFFAWWRNDEGCTRFDPYNYGDDFFAGSWPSLVDTCKLFYFTAETVFHWQSFRVKYACSHIPGVILKQPKNLEDRMYVAGYEFKGFEVVDEIPYATFIRKDHYNYWEKEEKTIKKVILDDGHRPDPE